MSRKSVLPQSPHHVMIFDEDWEFIREHYGPGSQSGLGISPTIQNIIHAYVRRLRAKAEQAASGGGGDVSISRRMVEEDQP